MNRIGGRAFTRTSNAVVAAVLIAAISAGSTHARAAEAADGSGAPVTGGPTEAPSAPSRGAFVAAELGAGAGGVFLSGLAGFATTLVVYKVAFHPSNDCVETCGLAEALFSLGVGGLALAGGYLAGVPTFVWLAGGGREGRGRYGAAIVGSVAGLALDVGITALAGKDGFFDNPSSGAFGTYVVTMLLLPVATSAAGFELSVRDEAPATARGPSVTPFVAPLSAHGGIGAGLAGRF